MRCLSELSFQMSWKSSLCPYPCLFCQGHKVLEPILHTPGDRQGYALHGSSVYYRTTVTLTFTPTCYFEFSIHQTCVSKNLADLVVDMQTQHKKAKSSQWIWTMLSSIFTLPQWWSWLLIPFLSYTTQRIITIMNVVVMAKQAEALFSFKTVSLHCNAILMAKRQHLSYITILQKPES